ncbi:hypothetical protein LOC54_03260 [Acetobacter sp. AN02]|uniref:hypothetical protein n=1 Tax=Acetobacter sp. AN02 TaxID=2894186 RepID=UPI002434346F|nr:hypothetical protein [Acetobacter sp. AN02]MDG6094142.1 hypothetical protein [Acetobacter sp. AN02]
MSRNRRCDDGASPHQGGRSSRPHPARRLPEKLLALAHQACDIGGPEIARDLLKIAERAMARRGATWELGRRRVYENLVTVYERVWNLTRPAEPPAPPAGEFSALRTWLLQHGDGRSS